MKNTALFLLSDFLIAIISVVLVGKAGLELYKPREAFARSHNFQRRTDLTAIADALYAYKRDHNNQFPTIIGKAPLLIKDANDADICKDIVTEYLQSMPYDPVAGRFQTCRIYASEYTIYINGEGKLVLNAPHAELGQSIEVVR